MHCKSAMLCYILHADKYCTLSGKPVKLKIDPISPLYVKISVAEYVANKFSRATYAIQKNFGHMVKQVLHQYQACSPLILHTPNRPVSGTSQTGP